MDKIKSCKKKSNIYETEMAKGEKKRESNDCGQNVSKKLE